MLDKIRFLALTIMLVMLCAYAKAGPTIPGKTENHEKIATHRAVYPSMTVDKSSEVKKPIDFKELRDVGERLLIQRTRGYYYWIEHYDLSPGYYRWFKWNMDNGQEMILTMTPPKGSDFDLYLYNPNGVEKAKATKGGDNTEVIHYTADMSGEWEARVTIYSGSGDFSFAWVKLNDDDVCFEVEEWYTDRHQDACGGDVCSYPSYEAYQYISNKFHDDGLKPVFVPGAIEWLPNNDWPTDEPDFDVRLVVDYDPGADHRGWYQPWNWTVVLTKVYGFPNEDKKLLLHELGHYRTCVDLYDTEADGIWDTVDDIISCATNPLVMRCPGFATNFHTSHENAIEWAESDTRLEDASQFLKVGDTYSSSIPSPGTTSDGKKYRMYSVVVDANTVNPLTVKMTNIPSGSDFDLYVRSLYVPEIYNEHYYEGEWEDVSYRGGNSDETCTITPTNKRVGILVRRYSGSGSYKLSIQQDPAGTGYSENFDDGSADMALSGLWHVTSYRDHSSSYSLAYNEESDHDYDTGSRNYGGAEFSVTLPSNPVLEFYHCYWTESYAGAYDVCRVQISTDGGSSWALLKQWDARDANITSWTKVALGLSAYSGNVKIRFYFDTIDGLYNNYEGWYIDDVVVKSSSKGEAVETPELVSEEGPPRDSKDLPTVYSLETSSNSFAVESSVYLAYSLPKSSNVSLKIYNPNGRLVKVLMEGKRESGYHTISWNGTDISGAKVPGGIYFVRMNADSFTKTLKITMIK
ncbi:T9SS type A sorting domain-containing protein [candidate division WOR-3 bacterium]|nr:T9SS type A sorting domain-containing protein [candidate division WOR-3 bacterium]